MAVKSSGAIDKALSAQRESKRIEFKQGFDPDCGGDWCEVIKDIVALANSGGGVLVFGLDDAGRSTNSDLTKLLQLDPADIQNRLGRYIGKEEIRLTIETPRKQKRQLIVWLIDAAEMPIIFEKPGTYPIDGGKQKAPSVRGPFTSGTEPRASRAITLTSAGPSAGTSIEFEKAGLRE